MTTHEPAKSVGRLLAPLEATLGAFWSLGEVVQASLRYAELGADPHLDALLEDLDRRGFYPELGARPLDFELRPGGWIVGDNPHHRVSGRGPDRIVAQLTPGSGQARTLVLVCHCYGVPSPRLMRSLFGLQGLDADVVTNIMAHHQPGSFVGWPGAGFTSARLSTFIENLRVAVTGVRALATWLRAQRSYERVVVLGFSMGGQLALHLANTGLVDRALLYCPAVSMHRSATELGLMGALHAPLMRLLERMGSGFSFDHLRLTEPLNHPLAIAPSDLHVVVQQHDALAPPRQVGLIREKYSEVGWYELPGTHLDPAGRRALHGIVRTVVT